MKSRPAQVALLMFLASGACMAAGPAATTQPVEPADRARQLVELLTRGQYQEFAAAGTEQIQELLPADKVKQAWEGVEGAFGRYQAEVSIDLREQGDLVIVTMPSRFERGMLDIEIVLDQQGRISGFWIRPNTENVPYESPAYVKRREFRDDPVTVSAGRFPLAGTISIPKADKPPAGFPGLVLVHGSGPHDEDETVFANKPFRDLAWGLASRGIAVVRYEKRTKKYPAAHTAEEITLHDETIEDALAAATLLRERPEVDPNRVFVLGHSLGAVAAPFIASEDPKLAGIIMMAACARPLVDVVQDQFEYIAAVDGEVSSDERKQLDEAGKALDEVRAGKVDGDPILGLPRAYLRMMNGYDPVPVAKDLTIPILILQGGRDYQVTDKDWKVWEESLGESANVTLRLLPRCNHLFIAGDGSSSPQEYQTAGHVSPEAIEAIAGWIRSSEAQSQ